jgi:hypothetical protein
MDIFALLNPFSLLGGVPSCLLFVIWILMELSVFVLRGQFFVFCAAIWCSLPAVL